MWTAGTHWCLRVGELVVAQKNNYTIYYPNNFIVGFHSTHVPHVLWLNTRIMSVTPLSTSEVMIFEGGKLLFSKNSADFLLGLFSLNHHY